MGLFGKKQEQMPDVPVDNRRVMRIVAARLAERDAEGGPALQEAARKLSQACQGATQAERRAAGEITRRHGY